MCAESDQYDRVCKGEFASIHTKLDKLDERQRQAGHPAPPGPPGVGRGQTQQGFLDGGGRHCDAGGRRRVEAPLLKEPGGRRWRLSLTSRTRW